MPISILTSESVREVSLVRSPIDAGNALRPVPDTDSDCRRTCSENTRVERW